jgi:hypothetical protein
VILAVLADRSLKRKKAQAGSVGGSAFNTQAPAAMATWDTWSVEAAKVKASTPAPAPTADTPAGAPSPPISVADELMKFVQLRDQGIITEEQFEAQRARLLRIR